MKKNNFLVASVVLGIILTALLFLYLYTANNNSSKNSPDNVIESKYQPIFFEDFKMTIQNTDNLEPKYIYLTDSPREFKTEAEENKCRVAINAGFFGGTREKAIHAGILNIDGEELAPIKLDDRQVYHIVEYDRGNNYTKMVGVEEYQSAKDSKKKDSEKYDLIFQTGPLILKDNLLQQEAIDQSKNGNGKYARSILAVADQTEWYLIAVKEPATLPELGKYINNLEMFEGKKLDLINLDGGPSVAFYNNENHGFDYNTESHLPLILCMR